MSRIAVTLLAFVVGCSAVLGQRLFYEARGTAQRPIHLVEPAGDLTGDGTPDFVVGHAGGVEVFSGGTGRWVRTLVKTTTVPLRLAAGPDADGDGVVDVAMSWLGTVELRSGKTGLLIRRLKGSAPAERFGQWIALVDDVDNDKRADVVVAAPGKWDYDSAKATQGYVAVYSTATGRPLRTTWFGHSTDLTSFHAGGDTDKDGRMDVQLGTTYHFFRLGRYNTKLYYSTPTASSWSPRNGIFSVVTGASEYGAKARYLVASSGDVDSDGYDDLMVGDPNGRTVAVYSARTSRLLHRHAALTGRVHGSMGDLDADLVPDYALESAPATVAVYSGRTHTFLWVRPGDASQQFAAQVLRLGDVDGDRVPELAISVPRSGFGALRVHTFHTYEWRAGFANLFEPTGKASFQPGLLLGWPPPPTPGGKLVAALDAKGYSFAVVLMGLVPHTGDLAPIPNNPLLLYVDRRFLLPFTFVVPITNGLGLLSLGLPDVDELVGLELALQAALFATSGPGAFGASNLLLAKVGLAAARGATLFRTPMALTIAADDNYRNVLKAPARLFHNHGDALILTFGGSKTPGAGPIEVRTAPGKPPTGGGLVLGTIPAAGASFGLRIWVPSGKGQPVGVYLLNRDPKITVTLKFLGLRVE